MRNTRRARAMEKGSKFGRDEQEKVWQNAEVDALRRLADAGVRVPRTYGMLEGVLLMELVVDDAGDVAPRLGEVVMDAEQAREDHALMMRFIVRMLCAGLIHGDLSEFNVLVDDDGPVIIDLPQAVDAAGNNNAPSATMVTPEPPVRAVKNAQAISATKAMPPGIQPNAAWLSRNMRSAVFDSLSKKPAKVNSGNAISTTELLSW